MKQPRKSKKPIIGKKPLPREKPSSDDFELLAYALMGKPRPKK